MLSTDNLIEPTSPVNAALRAAGKTVNILGVPIAWLTPKEALAHVLEARSRTVVYYANAHCVNVARKNPSYLKALERGDLVLNDGIGVNIAARVLYGRPFPDRILVTDWFFMFCAEAAKRRLKFFLLGTTADVVTAATRRLEETYPGLRVVGQHDGFFADAASAGVIDAINASGADVLFVGMSVPRQELWIDRHRDRLDVDQIHVVGGLIDFASGLTPRAPVWVQKVNFEWLFRLRTEPRRLWKRYIIGNPRFLLALLVAKLIGGGRIKRT